MIPGTPIGGIPYADGGNTCQFAHNYNAVCPYTNNGAPDVVYNFTPASNIAVDIDLCGAAYDSKVYVMTANQTCSAAMMMLAAARTASARSSNAASLPPARTYYIVVDGWSSVDCGTYSLVLSECTPCIVECPPGGVLEGEPVCGDNY